MAGREGASSARRPEAQGASSSRLRNELAIAQRRGDFEQAGEIAYGEHPAGCEKTLEEAEARAGAAHGARGR